MFDIQQFALKISQSTLTMQRKVEFLKYISATNPVHTDFELQIAEIYFNSLTSQSHLNVSIIAVLLSTKYEVTLDLQLSQKSSKFIFTISPILNPASHYNPVYTNHVIEFIKQIVAANVNKGFNIKLTMYDPLIEGCIGEIVWYNPLTTEMSVHWDYTNTEYKGNSGYTVRNYDTTCKMFSMMKRIGVSAGAGAGTNTNTNTNTNTTIKGNTTDGANTDIK